MRFIRVSVVVPCLALAMCVPVRSAAQTCDEAVSALLSTLVGEWQVDASRRVEVGRFESGEGLSRLDSTLGGCGLIDTRRLRYPDHERESVSVLSATREAAELSVVDSEHGAFTVSRGSVGADRMEFEWARDLGERVMGTRTEYTVVSSSEIRVLRMLRRRADEEWQVTFSATYTRGS
ncbi:MAG: hypothetical protein AAF389_18415 [Gemmatimonadota bacterium]